MNRIHYARQKRLLSFLRDDPRFDLQLVVGGSVLLEKYGEQFFDAIRRAGFRVDETLFNVVEGGNHVTMAKTAGLAALEFANSLYKLQPDIVLIRGDRFEQLAIAMVASYLNKIVAHIEGGDVSGTIDESVRHAITKLAHLHFVTNEPARRRVIQMGEDPASVFHVGSPDVEFASSVKKRLNGEVFNGIGTGYRIDFSKPYVVVMHHPVTTETRNREHVEELLAAVNALGAQAVWFWPNSDAGTNDIAKGIRVWREQGAFNGRRIRFITDVLPEDFLALVRGSSCLIGNSSAGIKECSYLGVPVVNIGSRQQGRLRASNVADVFWERRAIVAAARAQIRHGKYASSDIYYQPDTSRRIVEILARAKPRGQKVFFELKTA